MHSLTHVVLLGHRLASAQCHQGFQWTITSTLEDLDYADDLGLLSHRHQDIQQKTKDLCETASKIGLKVKIRKTQALRTNTNSITLEEKSLEEVQEFIYLGSKITADGDCIGEIIARISKASQAFAFLRPIWKTQNINTHTKIRTFHSNVLSVLLYGAECWKMTKSLEKRLEVFQNKCLRHVLKIFWPNIFSNENLRGRTGLEPLSTIIKERRWRWLGHVCRRPQESLIRRALRWYPQGQRSRGRPKETWRRAVEKDLKERGLSYKKYMHSS
ncbi:endonuclease-reverse transcriptase [Elysia marginata]|uniref:Endonuclease-reverse transcriptase n=1 Tax=Elysia marginata TaxID=1093978 RepID=A0AAV4F1R9_9GAST|nr:endonuclease-reverse transcriptase [Elysia marginata]